MQDTIQIFGARENNLKNINVTLPRNKLIVLTGISGSGKSSLAFDTLYAEGQRRYMESFSAYARHFLGDMERPDVDKIEGLSPVISIEQKTTSRNPRSTVGTVTEIYDFFRLLYARAGEAFSFKTGEKMVKQTENQIVERIISEHKNKNITLLAPIVQGRKGHYREVLLQIRKLGFLKVRIDGEIKEILPKMQLDRYKTHDIEIIIDRLIPTDLNQERVQKSVSTALHHGNGILLLMDADGNISFLSQNLMDPLSGLAYADPAPNSFSFNSPYGACAQCKGLGTIEKMDLKKIIPDSKKSISRGGLAPLGEYRDIWIFKKIESILKKNNCQLTTPIASIPKKILNILLYGDDQPIAVASVKYPGTEWNTHFEGIIPFLEKQKSNGTEKIHAWIKNFTDYTICPDCEGKRLKKESLHIKIANKDIGEISQYNLFQLADWIDHLEAKLSDKQKIIAKEILKEISKRLTFMLDVGLGYISMNRPFRSLSGGESQRIRLATQIGTQLINVLYILDEPSIGLHQRDNQKLIYSLKKLRDLGNTVIVVEHDKDMMLACDHIIDIGPGAGNKGGEIVASSSVPVFLQNDSLTASFLNEKIKINIPKERRKGNHKKIMLSGARGYNLKNVNVTIPLGVLVVVTGVSGSGKSTLIHETLYPILRKHLHHSQQEPLPFDSISGIENIDKVIEVDQSPIGRTPRSNPATYTGFFSDIRALFTQLPEAKIRGYKLGQFSFNVKGGRCETCQGGGMRIIEMDFLPDVLVACETCKGKRYNRETLEVRYKGKSISDVLDMTVHDAVDFFKKHPKIYKKIKTLEEVGLGYIALGQHATTLSGGEAQRVKLSSELSKKDTGNTLYILDEPSTGLHFQDIQHLLTVVNKLVDKGNTVLIIEHNLDIIKTADYVIDLGPEGGDGGGELVASGTPEEVAKVKNSHTATYLSKELQ